MDRLEQALGVLSLLVFAMAGGCSLWAIVATIAPKRRQILAALRGHPVTPAASLAPHASSNPQRRGVEAAAAPAFRGR